MYTKLEITGKIEILTGMHIGGSSSFSAIGAIDSPIVRDIESDLPMIPGSSLKGKIRYLLSKKYNKDIAKNHNEDDEAILRLFGSSDKEKLYRSRLIFSDSILSNIDKFKEIGIHNPTEIKTENSINRLTAIANPRQIERVIRGSEFDFSIIYNVETEEDVEDIEIDIDLLCQGLKLLKYDYIGGHGSRGYGRVNVKDLEIKEVTNNVLSIKKEDNDNKSVIESCKDLLEEV